MHKTTTQAILILGVLILATSLASALSSEWPAYRHDAGQSGYAPAESSYDLNYTGVLWSYKTSGWVRSSPVTADLNKDGLSEIVVGSDDGNIYSFKSNGSLYWKYSTGGKVRASPAAGNLNLDPYLEVVAGSEDGKIYALDHDGNLLWTYKVRDPVRLSPIIAELSSNNRGTEVAFASGSKIYILNSLGELVLEYNSKEEFSYAPAIADINKDGSMEFMFPSSDNTVMVLDKSFNVMKSFVAKGQFLTAPIALDIDNDQINEIVFASLGEGVYRVYHSTYTGANSCSTASCFEESVPYLRLYPTWNNRIGGKIMPPLTVADLNNDVKMETIIVAGPNTIHIFDDRGFNAMTYSANGNFNLPPGIADLDGDSVDEIIFGAEDANLYILNYPSGARLIQHISGSIHTTPAISDLSGDKKLEVIIGADDNSLYVLGDRYDIELMAASKSMDDAAKYVSLGDNKRALDQLSKALSLYIWLGDANGISTASDMMNQLNSSRNADVYLESANLAYSNFNLKDSKKFAEEAYRLYSMTNDPAGLAKSNDLLSKIKVYSDADANYKKGLNLYNSVGTSEEAVNYVNTARAQYLAVGYTPGVSKSDAVLKRMTADDYLSKGNEYYSIGDYGKSKEYGDMALSLYSELNFEQGMNSSVALIGASIRGISTISTGEDYSSLFSFVALIFLVLFLAVLLLLVYKYLYKGGFFSRFSLQKTKDKEGVEVESYSSWPTGAKIEVSKIPAVAVKSVAADVGAKSAPASEFEEKTPVPAESPKVEIESKPNAALAPVVEKVQPVDQTKMRVKYLKHAAKVKKAWSSGDPNDLVLLMMQLRKLGVMDALSLSDAMDILSVSSDTINRWVDKLVLRGWVRVFNIGGEKHVELTSAVLKGVTQNTGVDSVPTSLSNQSGLSSPGNISAYNPVQSPKVSQNVVKKNFDSVEVPVAAASPEDFNKLDRRHKEILSVLVDVNSASPVDVSLKVGRASRNVAYEMLELVNKGFLTRSKVGKTYVYTLRNEFRGR